MPDKNTLVGSVLIPAHNEATVIRRCLDSLFAEFLPGELEVVVSCNGCTDGTADIVRSTGHPARVVEVSQASKTAALRAGEEMLEMFPRLYLDADVILPSAAARLVLNQLRSGPALAARPPISYDTTKSSALVRSYYRARARIPSLMGALWGAGVYGLSAAGRARFADYPDAINDDLFIDQCFKQSEIEIVDSLPVVVIVPRQIKDLLRMLRRVYRGNTENRMLLTSGESTTRSTLHEMIRSATAGPGQATESVLYMAIAIAARLMLKSSASSDWERDDSSREV